MRRVLAIVREETAEDGGKGSGGGRRRNDGMASSVDVGDDAGDCDDEGESGETGGSGAGGTGPSLMKMLDAPDAPDYSRQPAKNLKGPILDSINELIEELSSVSAHIAEQARTASTVAGFHAPDAG